MIILEIRFLGVHSVYIYGVEFMIKITVMIVCYNLSTTGIVLTIGVVPLFRFDYEENI